MLQIGVALFVFSALEGFAIPTFPAPRLGLSVHTLSALQGVMLLGLGLAYAGTGNKEDEAISDAKVNFILSTFHVVYKSFINAADPLADANNGNYTPRVGSVIINAGYSGLVDSGFFTPSLDKKWKSARPTS